MPAIVAHISQSNAFIRRPQVILLCVKEKKKKKTFTFVATMKSHIVHKSKITVHLPIANCTPALATGTCRACRTRK